MNLPNKVHGILSLSAASLALIQSTPSGDSRLPDQPPTLGHSFDDKPFSTAPSLLLGPAIGNELLQQYAGHTSHASHASHYSGSGGGNFAPAAPAAPPAYYAPTYTQPQLPPPAVPVKTDSTQTSVPSADAASVKKSISTDMDIDSLKKQAAIGSADAQYELGFRFRYGLRGVEKNIDKAKILFELSAIQGNANAQMRLDQLKQTGN